MSYVTSFFGFIYDMLHDMFTSGWLGITLGILMVAVILFIVGAILYGVFYAIDSWFQPKQQAPGVIAGHDFTPAHTTYTYIDGVPYPQFHDDSWSVGVRVGKRHAWMCCDQACHDNYRDGQKVIATFTNGRLSNHMYVKAIRRS